MSILPKIPNTISVGNEIHLEIADVAFGGAGVGRLDGIACFVKGVIDGEQVKARVRRRKSRFIEADLLEVLQSSPHRVEAPCPYFLKCGGCAYQHSDYAHQLVIKEQQLREALRRIGGLQDPPVRSMIPSPEPFHYRNRITVHVKGGAPGFFVEKGNDVIEIDRCLLASEEVNQSLQQLRSQRPLDGNYLLGEKERYGGFRQVNNSVAAILLSEVVRSAESGEVLIDAYCGAGFFSHALREAFVKIIGIERSRKSITMARQVASQQFKSPVEVEVFDVFDPASTSSLNFNCGEAACSFLEGGVEELLPAVLQSVAASKSVLILDPPSEGISDLVAAAILENPPRKIIYVSCNPSTLARDVKRLSSCYQLQESTPLDMFPQTAEIESVNILVHK